jgi:RNase P/RNase MRP subunit p30
MGPARAACSEKQQLINRIRIATDAIIAFSKAEMEAMHAHNAAIEQALERRLNAARQDRAALVQSLQEHVRRHQC